MKMRVRIISLLLAFCLVLTMVACGKGGENPSESNPEQETKVQGAYEGDEFNNGAVGENGCVSSYNAIASQIGIDILKAGGNAVDAAVATTLAVGVVEPHHSGIGGSGLMTIYLANEKRYTTIEYLETIPSGGYDGYYVKAKYLNTARAAGVPGSVAGLAMALEKYGTMSWHDILQPIIKLCKEGFELDEVAADAMSAYADYFAMPGKEELYKHFTDEGFPYEAGSIFKNEDLGNTFETLANNGWQDFYRGTIAKKIADDMRKNGSLMDESDLAAYYAAEREPITSDYYGYKIVTIANPSVGGTLLLGALNIMEALNIKQYEQGSVEYWKVFNESCRYSSINSYNYSGDPAFYNMPSKVLTSQEYGDERAKLFSMDNALEKVPGSELESSKKETASSAGVALTVSPSTNPAAAGAPVQTYKGVKIDTSPVPATIDKVAYAKAYELGISKEEALNVIKKESAESEAESLADAADATAASTKDTSLDESQDTTHIAVIDKDGNIVSTTNTIGNSWGCMYMTPGLGFIFNTHLNNVSWTSETSPDYYKDAGKKVRSTMSPTIVTKDGEPVMAIGSPGSTVIPPVIASVINNILLYGNNVQQGINLPRAFTMDRTSEGPLTDITAETGRMTKATIRLLEVYGYTFRDGIDDYAEAEGGIAAIKINKEDGKIYGGGDPRRDYKAIAY